MDVFRFVVTVYLLPSARHSCFVLFVLNFIYFFISGCAGSLLLRRLWCTGSSLPWLLPLQRLDSRAQAQQLWRTGLVALGHVGSSRTGHQACVPYIGRWIPNHWTTR